MTEKLPAAPPMDGLTWRPAERSDAGAIVVLQDSCFEVDNTYREVESEILDRFDDEDVDPSTDTLLAVADDGRVLVSIWGYTPLGAATKWRAFADIEVHPDLRSDQLNEFALAWWEARSRQRLSERSDDLPKVLWHGVYEHQTDQIELLERNGYEIRRYYDELLRDLSQPIDPRPLPNGITLVPAEEAKPGDDLYVHNESFHDHRGSQPWTPKRWEHFKSEFYLPDASYVAYDGNDPVGHIFSTKYPHDFDDRGFTHAWIESLGVVGSHRKQGLASALLTVSMRDFVEDDTEYAMLGVDSENPTDAYGVYEDLGFTVDRRTVTLLKDV
jgi:ribosomal protein S18 acetylase RimI-like enzyme